MKYGTSLEDMQRIARGEAPEEQVDNIGRTTRQLMDQVTARDNIPIPVRPNRTDLFDSGGINLSDKLIPKDNMNRDFLNNMRTEGNRAGGDPSQWRTLMGQQLGQQKLGAQDTLARQNAAQLSQAQNQIGARGVGSGSRERVGSAGIGQGLGSAQGLERFYGGKGSELDIKDEALRQADLKALGQAELGVGVYDQSRKQYDISNTLKQHQINRAADLEAYNEAMRAWGTDKTARAI